MVLQLRPPWANGTTHLMFEPTALLERLAVLVPRPRVRLERPGPRVDKYQPKRTADRNRLVAQPFK